MCGLIVLAAAAGLGCGGDPTGDQVEQGQQVVADPSSVFLSTGGSEFVVVQVLDQLGNQLPVDFQPQNVGPGITVERDTTYLQTTIGTHLETAQRFIVTGTASTATQFDLVSGDVSTTIPVRVIPTSFAATFSNPAPAVNEEVTITLPAGYKFAPGASIATDKGTGVVRSFSADSTSINAIIPPGSAGAVTLDSVHVDFLPGVTLGGLPTDATVTADATPLAGTDAPASAPAVPVPAIGATTAFMDVGTFTAPDISTDGGVGAQYYQLVVPAAGDYSILLNWDGAADLDLELCSDATCSDGGTFLGTGTDQPELGTITLAPGTYYLDVVLFAGGAPPTFSAQISAVETPPPPAP